ncbi:protein translocase subunit secY/sec61 alpha [Marininema mesophilum]|uniref:Protein translocase subunit SecY n=1 Tax=Marininema mesophilum TaxID=1048340 RepID=A0A1H2XF75_9BACL|nr:preprotein translocase subunit SecY [Marininema mesophilum]SDW91114.1 protein translocase subunit secY/sec61 alpha [Marininema mesophilum]
MFQTVSNIWKVEDLRRRILFTLAMLIVFRIGAHVPVPGTDSDALQRMAEQSGALGLINTFSGGALANFSIFAMGIMPYITASIIVQLLTMDVIPAFARWAKEGEVGRRKLGQVTRYGTIILGLIQSIGLTIGFSKMSAQAGGQFIKTSDVSTFALIALTLTAGTAFLMWLGEQITEKGIGNGISIIIFGGIIAGIPGGAQQIYTSLFQKNEGQVFLGIVEVVLILAVIVALIAGVIFIQQGIRKIPVQYAKRVVGRKMFGGQSTHIPMKVNAAGVIPVIFAMSLLLFPVTIAQFWKGNAFADWITANFQLGAPLGTVFYVLLIIGFTYFYTFVQINPMQLSDQMKKNGGYIPGIRPGKNTTTYLTRIMNRITLAGSLFLAAIAVLPVFFTKLAGLPASVQIGGTSILIVIGVALETMKTIESQLIKRHYKGFINK